MTGWRLNLLRAVYLVLAVLCITVPLITLDYSVHRRLPPDLLFALTIAWIIRHHRSANMPLVIIMALLADFVLMRPVGLGAMMLLITSEVARNNARVLRDYGFVLEWVAVGMGFVLMMLAQNLLLALSLSNPLSLGDIGRITLATFVSYPFIVAFLRYIIRIRPTTTRLKINRLGRVI
ncbi:MAG: hypothetical protein WD046_04860 [Paracoccaceae bacterium]